jgi:hypothetical protein
MDMPTIRYISKELQNTERECRDPNRMLICDAMIFDAMQKKCRDFDDYLKYQTYFNTLNL